MTNWSYYNHALVSWDDPSLSQDASELKSREIWNKYPKAFFARWITDWDTKESNDFYYVIKDIPFDINSIKSKYRYQINKGLSNFYSTIINPYDYLTDLVEIQKEAYRAYNDKSELSIDRTIWNNCDYIGTFNKDSKKLCGYAIVNYAAGGRILQFAVMKTIPEYEKSYISEAIIYFLLKYYEEKINDGYYISDGSKTIMHQTGFQEYLIRKFQFRKAYCKLNIKYRNALIRNIINILAKLRIDKLVNNRKVTALLWMHRIANVIK